MSRRDKNLIYIRLMNFDEEANKAVNRAIIYSADAKCAEVNSVHLFLALIEHTELGGSILNHLNMTFDDMFNVYLDLADQGVYGEFDSSNVEFTPEYFSRDIFVLSATCAQKSFMNNKEVTTSMLLDELFELDSDELNCFLDYLGFDMNDLDNIMVKSLHIPDRLSAFIEDIHNSNEVLNQKIENVDNYVDDMIEVLSRKKKASPCIIGEAGVGKTAIVYRLAQRINEGSVPDEFKDIRLVYINGSTLSSGTRFRGDFEERMRNIMDWAAKNNVILFLDEIHTFINSGNTGHNDGATAGNMIKKYLADGSIKIVGTTTLAEYHSSIEKDKAFNRRVQKIVISEPSVGAAISMIKKSASDYEAFHNVTINDSIIELAVKLSDKYIKNSCLPDKAYTIIDQACAKTKINKEKVVSEDTVLEVVSKTTGINVNKLGDKEVKNLIKLESIIGKNLIGQEKAVSTVCKAIRRAKAGVSNSDKPLASFLFVGPTGVGKTELCKILSKEVGLGKDSFIKIDMSEFSEKNSVSRLLGTTAGYIGYGDGGQLTEKVKHNPYSIVLLDEIEKAHPDIFNTFLQLLDEGRLTDGEGTTVDFTNCIIIMTSNAGYGADGNKANLGFGASNNDVSPREAERKALKALEDTFRPEFLNRIDNVVIFEKLTKEQCVSITKLMLNKISDRLKDKNINIKFSKSVINMLVEIGFSDKYGARNIRREIQDTVEDFLADAILSSELKENETKTLYYRNKELSFNKDMEEN